MWYVHIIQTEDVDSGKIYGSQNFVFPKSSETLRAGHKFFYVVTNTVFINLMCFILPLTDEIYSFTFSPVETIQIFKKVYSFSF
jgi:hypothetical protein